MNRGFFNQPIVKILIVTGFVLGLGGLIYCMSGLPSPRERDRVGPENGAFSIIKPRDWQHKISYAPDQKFLASIDIYQPQTVGIPQEFSVGQLRNPPDIGKLKSDGFREDQFQDQPAYVMTSTASKAFAWEAVFQRNGKWFEMDLHLPEMQDIPHSPWLAYLNSFRSK